MAIIRTNKPDAARRQCDAAIRMLFRREDPLAVATVAGAAFRLVRDLSEKKGDGRVWGHIKRMIRPGIEAEAWKVFNKVPNFLKHADNDSAAILDDVEESFVDSVIVFTIWLYADLGYQRTPAMLTFEGWFALTHPSEVVTQPPLPPHLQMAFADTARLSKTATRAELLEFGRLGLLEGG